MQKEILILEPFKSHHLEQIKNAAGPDFSITQILPSADCDEAELKAAISRAEIIVGVPKIELLQNPQTSCPNLKFLQMTWAGTDIYTRNVLPFPPNVTLSNATGVYGLSISQFVICQILTLMLNFKAYHTQQQKKIWERRGPIQSLEGATVLIYGAGDIGSTTAKRLCGFDCHTIGVCRNTSKPRAYFNELCTLNNAEKFLPQADVVVCCIPNSEETAGYFDERRLRLMKTGAILVNVGRGNFIDNNALDKLLCEEKLWGAALDVTNPEPLPENHPLWENPRCLITPHTSGVAFNHLEETEDMLCALACENITNYRNHTKLRNVCL